jgi:hypothetical protein
LIVIRVAKVQIQVGTGRYVAMSKKQQLPDFVSTEIKKKKQECPVDLDPLTAASTVQTLLKLSEEEKEKLHSVLLQLSEDPILALKINPVWAAHHGAVATTAVLIEIVGFDVPNGERRDEKCPGFLFHFKTVHELRTCRASVLQNHRTAFALSPESLARMGPAAAALIAAHDREPLAYTAVIHKVGVREDDVDAFEFFYT